MANVLKTVITYPLDGSTKDFNIPFEYLARKFVQVTLIGVDRQQLTNIDDYRFTTKTQITTNKAWAAGDGYTMIEIRRFTSATERLVDFSDGSILRAYDLNVSQIQTLHVAEEARDLTADTIGVNNQGDLDARGRRIVNVADPVADGDAINLRTVTQWNNSAYQSYIKAQQEASAAEAARINAQSYMQSALSSKNAALVSENNSKASETSATNSKNAAASSAQSASLSAGSASSSAQAATDSKDYALQQANRSYNEAERAKGYADSMGNAIDIGEVIRTMDTNSGHVVWKGDHVFNQYAGCSDDVTTSPQSRIQLEARKSANNPAISVMHDYSMWKYYTFDKDNAGVLATQPWVNKMIYLPNASVTRVKSPNNNYVLQMENGGIYGFKDTVKDIYTFAMKSGEPHFYDTSVLYIHGRNDWPGLTLYRTDGSQLRLEANPSNSTTLFNIVSRDSSGNNQLGFSVPRENGTAATREWSNSQYVRKAPSSRTIWTGTFQGGNTITLSESIIGKVIAVRSKDRDRWEVIHILWAGSWATGRGSSINMFTVAANGRTLTSNYEENNGYWVEIRVVE